jgi:NAD(P)-dependent dehydrogenase (short-subunit alcohol dehydrogenase family)
MTMVVVFGGGGFFGRRLVDRLTAQGMTVRVAVRHPDHARTELQSIGFDRVTVVPADVRDQASVAAAIAGADAVVNTVSAYVEKGGVTFEAVHVQGAHTVARETIAAAVPRLVLVSGIGADADSGSPYIRARDRGEQWSSRRSGRLPTILNMAILPQVLACPPSQPGRCTYRTCGIDTSLVGNSGWTGPQRREDRQRLLDRTSVSGPPAISWMRRQGPGALTLSGI